MLSAGTCRVSCPKTAGAVRIESASATTTDQGRAFDVPRRVSVANILPPFVKRGASPCAGAAVLYLYSFVTARRLRPSDASDTLLVAVSHDAEEARDDGHHGLHQ